MAPLSQHLALRSPLPLTEALIAVQLLDPGVYCVMHGKALRFPGVVKDKDLSTFVRRDG